MRRLKRVMASLRVGTMVVVPAYKDAEHPGGHPAPLAYRYARDYGYTLEVVGYAEEAGKPVAFLRRTA